MQLIYAFPFVFISIIAFVVCMCSDRFRSYALQALVAPVAFGVCSIIGLAMVMLSIDTRFDSMPKGIATAIPLVAYLGFGLVGAWLSIKIAKILKLAISKKTGKP